MNSRFSRVILGALASLFLLGTGLFAAHRYMVERVETELRNRGFSWIKTDHGWIDLRWSGVTTPFGTVEQMAFNLQHVKAQLTTVDIDLSGMAARTAESKSPSAPLATAPPTPEQPFSLPSMTIEVSHLRIHASEHAFLDAVLPISSADDQTWTLGQQEPNEWLLGGTDLVFDTAGQTLEGVTVILVSGHAPRLEVSIPEFAVNHPSIAQSSLPNQPMRLAIRQLNEPSSFRVEASYGAIDATTNLTISEGNLNAAIEIPMTPIDDIASVFGELIPETSQMDMSGNIGLNATVAGPPWSWTANPQASELSVSGGLPGDLGDSQVRFKAGDSTHVVGPAIDGWVPLNEAGWMAEATIAAEDIRFQEHPGYDLIAIQEAIDSAPNEERIRGGSTISQQLAKNLFLDGRRTLLRKYRELLLALALENRMSKDGILQLYLNVVEFGPNIRGVDQAANAWFLKNPDQLSPREAAFLAAILPAPNAWHERISKTGKPPVLVVDRVLDRMRRKRVLTAEEHRRARSRRLRIVPP